VRFHFQAQAFLQLAQSKRDQLSRARMFDLEPIHGDLIHKYWEHEQGV
jgi:hypothetical protein